MKIVIENNEIKINNCKSFKDRLFGLMFKKNVNTGLLFEKCSAIHTFFMKEAIDVIALDKNNIVINYVKGLKPYRFYRIKDAKKIIELPNNSIKKDILNTKIIFRS